MYDAFFLELNERCQHDALEQRDESRTIPDCHPPRYRLVHKLISTNHTRKLLLYQMLQSLSVGVGGIVRADVVPNTPLESTYRVIWPLMARPCPHGTLKVKITHSRSNGKGKNMKRALYLHGTGCFLVTEVDNSIELVAKCVVTGWVAESRLQNLRPISIGIIVTCWYVRHGSLRSTLCGGSLLFLWYWLHHLKLLLSICISSVPKNGER